MSSKVRARAGLLSRKQQSNQVIHVDGLDIDEMRASSMSMKVYFSSCRALHPRPILAFHYRVTRELKAGVYRISPKVITS
jgi:hypothetical protein